MLITGQDRSLVTKLDAANCFTVDHLEPNWPVVEQAKTYYREKSDWSATIFCRAISH